MCELGIILESLRRLSSFGAEITMDNCGVNCGVTGLNGPILLG